MYLKYFENFMEYVFIYFIMYFIIFTTFLFELYKNVFYNIGLIIFSSFSMSPNYLESATLVPILLLLIYCILFTYIGPPRITLHLVFGHFRHFTLSILYDLPIKYKYK